MDRFPYSLEFKQNSLKEVTEFITGCKTFFDRNGFLRFVMTDKDPVYSSDESNCILCPDYKHSEFAQDQALSILCRDEKGLLSIRESLRDAIISLLKTSNLKLNPPIDEGIDLYQLIAYIKQCIPSVEGRFDFILREVQKRKEQDSMQLRDHCVDSITDMFLEVLNDLLHRTNKDYAESLLYYGIKGEKAVSDSKEFITHTVNRLDSSPYPVGTTVIRNIDILNTILLRLGCLQITPVYQVDVTEGRSIERFIEGEVDGR